MMTDQEYISGLNELQAIQQQIESQGTYAALIHKSKIQKLTPVILAEALEREHARAMREEAFAYGD